jgi:hypothetical protein
LTAAQSCVGGLDRIRIELIKADDDGDQVDDEEERADDDNDDGSAFSVIVTDASYWRRAGPDERRMFQERNALEAKRRT